MDGTPEGLGAAWGFSLQNQLLRRGTHLFESPKSEMALALGAALAAAPRDAPGGAGRPAWGCRVSGR
jgi:hypothetical protein